MKNYFPNNNDLENLLKKKNFDLVNFEENKNIFVLVKKKGLNILNIYLSSKNIPSMNKTKIKNDMTRGKNCF